MARSQFRAGGAADCVTDGALPGIAVSRRAGVRPWLAYHRRMKRSRLRIVASVVAAIAGSGCAAEPDVSGGLPVAISPLAAASAMRIYSGMTTRQRLVVHDVATWANAWQELVGTLQPPPALPAIDFGTTVVVVAGMGERTSGGYAVTVNEVQVNSAGNASITVTEQSPGPTCVTTAAITDPADVVVAARFDGEAKFVERTSQAVCR